MYKNKKGVTLIEVIIVLLISIIVLNVGAAAFIPVEKRRLDKAAVDLQNEIRYIQRMALSEKTDYMLIFDLETRDYYSLYKRDGDVYSLVRDTYFPDGIILINTSAEYAIIRFTQKGTIVRACAVIMAGSKYNIALTCAVGTGNVSIKEIRPRTNMYKLSEF